jgi:predicted PurR-regulated permease PerM
MEFSKIRNYLFLSLLCLLTLVFIYLLKPLAFPIFWAAIIAVIFYPLYRWLNKKIGVPNLSTTIILVIVLLVIIIPLSIVSSLLIKETIEFYNSTANNQEQIVSTIHNAKMWIMKNPYVIKFNIDENFWLDKYSDFIKIASDTALNFAKTFTQNSIVFLVMLIITLYIIFYFVRDGEKILQKFYYLCPLGDKHEKMLFHKFTSTVRAVIKGQIIVGIIQGVLGGIMFAVLGIKGAVLWGVLMSLVSIFPFIGSYLVWIPAAIGMMLTGKIWQGIFIILFGVLIIHPIDNILRPLLVGKETQIHPLLIMFSILSGIAAFGISGIIIGPVIIALLLAFWEMYAEYYKKDLKNN